MSEAAPAPPETPALAFPLQEGERVLQLCRRHWLYLWPNIAFKLLLAFLPPAAIAILLSVLDAYEGTAARVFWVASAVYFAYWFVRLFLIWYRYHHDVWVITNQRLIDAYKAHPFNLRLSTADLVNVQDMTVSRSGVLQTMLDYGDIICQTAAEHQELRLTGIPHPREVQALVDRERDRERMRSA
jgi:hypothetical protein